MRRRLNALAMRRGFAAWFIICALADSRCHRSEPDWNFQEKSIHRWLDRA
jgi:hypothetical protein